MESSDQEDVSSHTHEKPVEEEEQSQSVIEKPKKQKRHYEKTPARMAAIERMVEARKQKAEEAKKQRDQKDLERSRSISSSEENVQTRPVQRDPSPQHERSEQKRYRGIEKSKKMPKKEKQSIPSPPPPAPAPAPLDDDDEEQYRPHVRRNNPQARNDRRERNYFVV